MFTATDAHTESERQRQREALWTTNNDYKIGCKTEMEAYLDKVTTINVVTHELCYGVTGGTVFASDILQDKTCVHCL